MSVAPVRRPEGHRPNVLTSPGIKQFRADLAPYARAHRRQRTVLLALRATALLFALMALGLAATRAIGLVVADWVLVLPPALGLIVGVVAGRARRPRSVALARAIDHRLALRERTLAAVELSVPRGGAPGVGLAPLEAAQLHDATRHLHRADPLVAFPIVLPRRDLIVVVATALVLAAVWLAWPAPTTGVAVPTGYDEVALTEAERLDDLADEIIQTPSLGAEEAARAEVAELLHEASEALRDPTEMTPEQAMASLADLERRLAGLQDPSAVDVQQALARLADSMDQNAATRPVSAALDRNDYQRAADELQQLARQAMADPEQRQAVAEALRQAARSTNRYDQSLSDSLRRAAEQMENGQSDDPAGEAADEMRRAGGRQATQEAIQRALSQLAQARSSVGSAASDQPGSAQGSPGEPGEGAGQPGGRQPGTGLGENGEGGDGSGIGTGSNGQSGAPTSSDGLRSRLSQVLTGELDRPTIGHGEQIGDGPEGTITVDYRSVLPVYQERATRALQDRYVPLQMKELVREYFSSLQPAN